MLNTAIRYFNICFVSSISTLNSLRIAYHQHSTQPIGITYTRLVSCASTSMLVPPLTTCVHDHVSLCSQPVLDSIADYSTYQSCYGNGSARGTDLRLHIFFLEPFTGFQVTLQGSRVTGRHSGPFLDAFSIVPRVCEPFQRWPNGSSKSVKRAFYCSARSRRPRCYGSCG
jgi:hypothetical protein